MVTAFRNIANASKISKIRYPTKEFGDTLCMQIFQDDFRSVRFPWEE